MSAFKKHRSIKGATGIGTIEKAKNWFLDCELVKNHIDDDRISIEIENLYKSQKVIKVTILGNLVLQNDDIYTKFETALFNKPLLIRCSCRLTVLDNLTIEELNQRIKRFSERGTKVDDCKDFLSEVCKLITKRSWDCNSEIFRCLKKLCEESESNKGSNENCIKDSLTLAEIENLRERLGGITEKPIDEQLEELNSMFEEEKLKNILDCEDEYSVKIGDYVDTLKKKLK